MVALASNRATAPPFGGFRSNLRTTAVVMQKARVLFPNKTAENLSVVTGYSLRSCESWLYGEAKIPADALAALIRSESGRDFLSAVMSESRAPWWRRFLRIDLVASVKRRHAADRRLLEQAFEADCETSDAIARAEAALAAVSVQDPEFAGAGLDALREALRIPRGAVARAAGQPSKPKARRG